MGKWDMLFPFNKVFLHCNSHLYIPRTVLKLIKVDGNL